MALRDQPYIPLYVQDIMTDEKLNECCASTHGIYIKGIMCLMHKSKTYGKILLLQKYQQNTKQSLNFATQLAKHLPYTPDEIMLAIDELILNDVCQYEGDYLCQKRMIKDNDISIKRIKAGSKGGFAKANNIANSVAKVIANSENENENENENNFEDGAEETFETSTKFYYDDFVDMVNAKRKTQFTKLSQFGRSGFIQLVGNGFTKDDFELVLENACKDQFHLEKGNITPDKLCQSEVFEKYLNIKEIEHTDQKPVFKINKVTQ